MAGGTLDSTGECCICGCVGKLTFEHVPPEAAFNDRRVFQAKIEELLGGKWTPGTPITRGKYVQRGAGRHSLCAKCNNNTGAWYGTAYIDFARQAMILLHRSNGKLSLAYPYGIFPLRVMKQIVVMFFSACGPGLRKAHPDLVKFVLDRERRLLPKDIHIWAYLNDPVESTSTRQSGITGLMSLGGDLHVFSEIAFPPFGLIMSFKAEPVHKGLCDITHFGHSSINTWDVVFLKLPVFPVVSFFPGDFRTVDELKKTVEENRKLGSYHLDHVAEVAAEAVKLPDHEGIARWSSVDNDIQVMKLDVHLDDPRGYGDTLLFPCFLLSSANALTFPFLFGGLHWQPGQGSAVTKTVWENSKLSP